MKKLLILPLALLAMYSCGNKNKTLQEQAVIEHAPFNDGHNARNSLSYHGTYKGVIPAADCPGIEITVEIPNDSTYSMTSVYLEHEDTRETITGKYTWNEAGNTITLAQSEAFNIYFVAEGFLIMRDKDGQKIEGELVEHYNLAKID